MSLSTWFSNTIVADEETSKRYDAVEKEFEEEEQQADRGRPPNFVLAAILVVMGLLLATGLFFTVKAVITALIKALS